MTQHCPRCNQSLTENAYHADKWGRPGQYCRACIVQYKREWKAARTWEGPPPAPPRLAHVTYRGIQPMNGYGRMHNWLRRLYGPAKNQTCRHCGSQADHWAYDHADPHEVRGPNNRGLTVTYSRNPTHYIPLCISCHNTLDAAPRRGGTWTGRSGSTTAWRKTRANVLARDRYQCQLRLPGVCTGHATHVHHTRTDTGDDPRYLQGSCAPCNLKTGRPTTTADPACAPVTQW